MIERADDEPLTRIVLNIATANTVWWLMLQMQITSYQMLLTYPEFMKTMHGDYDGH